MQGQHGKLGHGMELVALRESLVSLMWLWESKVGKRFHCLNICGSYTLLPIRIIALLVWALSLSLFFLRYNPHAID